MQIAIILGWMPKTNMETKRALRMLASLAGGYYTPDFHHGEWEGEDSPPSEQELVSALASLDSEGLVVSMLQRLPHLRGTLHRCPSGDFSRFS